MTQKRWKTRIKKACQQAETYLPIFDSVIDTLASILARRDKAIQLFEDDGSRMLVEHTNKVGATNVEQNPLLRMINDLNRDALSYWRDLGLTPAGLKKINETALKGQKMDALSAALKELGG